MDRNRRHYRDRSRDRNEQRSGSHRRPQSPRRRSLSPHRRNRRPTQRQGADQRWNTNNEGRIQRYVEHEQFAALTLNDLSLRDVTRPPREGYVFPSLPRSDILRQTGHGFHNPDVLERINTTATPSLNWVTETGKKGEYFIKGTMNDAAIENLTNTLKDLALKNGGVCYNMTVQFLCASKAREHLDRVDKSYQQAHQRLTYGDPPRGNSAARSVLPLTLTGPGRESQPVGVDEAEEAAAPQQLTCGNCRKPGHVLVDCVIANEKDGFVHGCPICNTSRHTLDNCRRRSEDETQRREQALELMYRKRFNKPMILSYTYTWPYLVACTIANQNGIRPRAFDTIVDELKLEPPMNMYPWSTDFAIEIMKYTPHELEVAYGAVHPLVFDYDENDLKKLPTDWGYTEKFGPFMGVIDAYTRREWKVPRPPTSKVKKQYGNRGDYMYKQIKGLLTGHGLIPKTVKESGQGITMIKQEEENGPVRLNDIATYDSLRESAKQFYEGPAPEKPKSFKRPTVEVRGGNDVELIVLDDPPAAGESHVWPEKYHYIGSTWNDRHVSYHTVDEEGDWCVKWVVRQYVHLSADEFQKLPRGKDEPDLAKRLALHAIDKIVSKWKQGKLGGQPRIEKKRVTKSGPAAPATMSDSAPGGLSQD
ncbi:uncharacterized protein B0T23DRAFT_392948 [Neurospora hispaniola]|uniref:CCHC-type domain-containing protein n=1 Tax=Neurospora hispaniola TaxID=588809 RepID=A0AAJ0IHG9_9PEZI|nr:hypothetical protein B0T23DRAFT_392948 [Neurospora hispaniola]